MKYPSLIDKKIFLDLDGVLVDFIGGMLEWFNINPDVYYKNTPPGHWKITPRKHLKLNMSKEVFWANLTYEFWSNLKPTSYMTAILNELDQLEMAILTASNINAASGKLFWVKKHLPSIWKDGKILICRNKSVCANRNAILIDDCDKNIDNFIKAGGQAILFPQRWNRLHRYRHDPICYLREQLELMGCR